MESPDEILRVLAEQKTLHGRLAQQSLEYHTDEQKHQFLEECFRMIDQNSVNSIGALGGTAYDMIVDYHFRNEPD